MSISPLQNILSSSTPEERKWIRAQTQPNPDWKTRGERAFYEKQWALLRACREQEEWVPDWLLKRYRGSRLTTPRNGVTVLEQVGNGAERP